MTVPISPKQGPSPDAPHDASSGRGFRQPPAPGSAPVPVGPSGEPLGYNLEDAAVYEQPPAPPQPYRLPAPAVARPADVIGGLAFALLGLGALVFMPPLALGLSGAGALSCAIAMIRSRRGPAINRWLAISGIILGLVGLALAFLVMADFSTGYEVLSPS
jgi:hypothetical protein